jgi:hypothetical protein
VRPLPPTWTLALSFLAVFAAVSLAGAWALGMYGLRALSGPQRVSIFSVVTCIAGFAAVAAAREMRPAAGRRIAGATLLAGAAAVLAVFALLFRDYGMRQFIHQGVPCLVAGLTFAVPAALLVSLLVHRGFVLNLVAAGMAAGTLAGLAGLGTLELHCPNVNAAHVMVWHVAVVVISGIAGLLIGWMFAQRRKQG